MSTRSTAAPGQQHRKQHLGLSVSAKGELSDRSLSRATGAREANFVMDGSNEFETCRKIKPSPRRAPMMWYEHGERRWKHT